MSARESIPASIYQSRGHRPPRAVRSQLCGICQSSVRNLIRDKPVDHNPTDRNKHFNHVSDEASIDAGDQYLPEVAVEEGSYDRAAHHLLIKRSTQKTREEHSTKYPGKAEICIKRSQNRRQLAEADKFVTKEILEKKVAAGVTSGQKLGNEAKQ